MKRYTTKFYLVTIFLFFSLFLSAKSFEGSISMVKESCFDTTFYTYFVYDGKIRIEEMNSKKILQSICLINTNNQDVFIINPEKKLYTKLKKKSVHYNDNNEFVINKTTNYKWLNGVKCYQWRVKNVDKNTEISYWVTQNDFGFFEKMVNVLNNTNESWEFFNHIPNANGFLPMVSEERNLVRDEKLHTEVLKINRRPIDSSMFKIPANYKIFVM
jgi:hypothetical protein